MPHRSPRTARHQPAHLAQPVRRSRRPLVLGMGAAALVTGAVVGLGSLSGATTVGAPTASLASASVSEGDGVAALTADEIAEREERVSRSADRTAAADETKSGQLASDAGPAQTNRQDLSDADPKTLARALMPEYGLSTGDFSCLESLWDKESGWSTTADNPSSSAYGIPQALPGSKMSSAGPNWESSAETQIRWGLGYIRDRYGSACGAWGHSQSNNWY